MSSVRSLLAGLLAFGLTLLCLLILTRLEPELLAVYESHTQAMRELWHFATKNLEGSIGLFVLVSLAYLWQMLSLGKLFRMRCPAVEQVMRKEQLLDLCASLFFGIGVIWTAIGMRGALLYALGDGAGLAANSGSAVLQRLVDGGILLALSTTIVGGVGGYLMRAAKQLVYGRELALVYLAAARSSRHEPGALASKEHEGQAQAQPAPQVIAP